MPSIDTLSIRISASTTDAATKVKGLTQALTDLVSVINQLDIGKFESLSRAVNDLSQGIAGIKGTSAKELKSISKAVSSFNEPAKGGALESVEKGVKNVSEESKKATENLENVNATFDKFDTSATEEMANSMQKMSNTVRRASEETESLARKLTQTKFVVPTDGLEKVDKKIQSLKDRIDELKAKLEFKSQTDSEYVDSKKMEKDQEKIQGLINELDRLLLKKQELESHGGFKLNLGDIASSFSKGFSSVTKKIDGIISKVVKLKKHMHGVTDATKALSKASSKLTKELGRVTKMLKLMITRMILRKVIQGVIDGFKNLAQYSSEFDASVSLLWNSFRQLGNAIAAAVSPLLNAFAPALNYIIQLCIKAVNAINQLLSALTGATAWTRAKTLSDSYAKSLDKSNKSAKELKRTILGFDEINKLDDNKDSGGGGTSPLNMFDEAPIEDKWKSWADKLKEMWNKADFTEVGSEIGEWLLNALNSIPWGKIKAKAYKFGKSLATLINGIIETPTLGRTIGKSLAEAINTGVQLAKGFIKNIHWDSLGKFIAESFNGFFENIDWVEIKDTVVSGFRGLAIGIQSFIETFNWDNISETVINGLDTVSSAIKAFFENIKWKDLGTKFGKQLKKIIEKTNWKQIGEAIGDVVQAAIDFVASTLDQLSWTSVIKAITDLISGFFNKADWATIDRIIGFLLETAVLAGVANLVLTAAKRALVSKLETWIASALFDKAVTNAASKGLADAMTSAAGSQTLSTAGMSAGATIGTVLGGAIAASTAGILGQQLGNELGKSEIIQAIFPDTKDLYDQYTGIDGFFRELKDLAVGVYDLIDMKVEDLTKDHIEMTETQKKNLDEMKAKADEAAAAYSKIYDTQAADSLKKMKEHSDALKESLDHIKDSKAAEAFANWKGIIDDTSESSDGLLIIVEHDKEAIEETHYEWSDFMDDLSAGNFHSLDELTDGFNRVEGAVEKDVAELRKMADEMDTVTFKPLSDDIEYNTTKASNSIHIFDTKAEEAFKNMSKQTEPLKISVESLGTTYEEVKVDMEQAMSGAQESMSGTWTEISYDASKGMGDVEKTVTDGTAEINKSFDTVKDGMTEDKWTFSGVIDGLKKTFEDALNGVKGLWDKFADKLNGEYELGSAKFKIHLPKFFATGGFPDPEDGWFRASHGEMLGKFDNGQSVVANNEQITNGIAQAVYSAIMSANSGGTTRYINNTIQIDGRAIARAVTVGQDDQNRRYSPVMV